MFDENVSNSFSSNTGLYFAQLKCQYKAKKSLKPKWIDSVVSMLEEA